jgi:multidrug efflux pump subunit AcrB
MWIVNLALRRPYTFVVMAIFILVLGGTSVHQMRTDIFPEIDLPVVTVVWTYKGMDAEEMERRITTLSEYAISSNVNDIRTIESQTVTGVAVIKVYFHPGTDVGQALSQVTAASQAIRSIMPPNVQPPIILRFNASSVPIVQLSLSSETMSEAEVYDYALWQLRTQLAVIQGVTMPAPYGGKERQIMVDLDPALLRARGISPKEVSDAITANNLALPTGVARIGGNEFPVSLNNSPLAPEAFNDIPIKEVNGAMVYMRDLGQVRDGATTQTTVVRRDGQRGALVTILKNGNASTLDIVRQIKAKLPELQAAAPPLARSTCCSINRCSWPPPSREWSTRASLPVCLQQP